jgi:hypothetical protein
MCNIKMNIGVAGCEYGYVNYKELAQDRFEWNVL